MIAELSSQTVKARKQGRDFAFSTNGTEQLNKYMGKRNLDSTSLHTQK